MVIHERYKLGLVFNFLFNINLNVKRKAAVNILDTFIILVQTVTNDVHIIEEHI